MQTVAICPLIGSVSINDPTTAFGARLRRLRGRLSQEELAELSGVSAAYISQLETGRRGRARPSMAIVERLASALDVTPAYLLGEEDPALEALTNSPSLDQLDRDSLAHIYRRLAELLTLTGETTD